MGLSMPVTEKMKKGIIVLAWVTDLNYWRQIELLFHNRGREEYVWNTGDPVDILLLPSPWLDTTENYHHLNKQDY